MSDEMKFCYRCGANLPQGAEFCPECGYRLGENPSAEPRAEYTATRVDNASMKIGMAPTLIMIYGIISIIGGIFTILLGMSIDSMLDILKEMYEEGSITEADYDNMVALFKQLNMIACTAIGVIHITSGILAIISSTWASKLVKWKGSVVLCGVAALLPAFEFIFDPFMAVALPVVGFLMTYLIYQKRDLFVS